MADIVISGNTSGAVTLRAPDVSGTTLLTLPTTSGTIVTTAGATSLTTSGNLTFTGTGNRITGDFSNATIANRVLFQTSTTNASTIISAIPNGTGVAGQFAAYNNSDPANAGTLVLSALSADARIATGLTGTGTYLPLTMYTGGSERLRIDTSGNVGIGTSSPIRRFQVHTSGTNGEIAVTDGTLGNTYGGILRGYGVAGQGGYVELGALDNSVDYSKGIRITQYATSVQFFTGTTVANNTERMRITSGGDLLVGVTSTAIGERLNASGTGTYVSWIQQQSSTNNGLFVYLQGNRAGDGTFAAYAYGDDFGTRFRVLGSGNVQNSNNSYGGISDLKLKENIVDATPKLQKLNQVRVVNYNLKGETTKQIGVIAQELEQIFPSMVEEHQDKDKEGNDLGTTTKSVKYSVFVPMLIKAIQELNAKVEAQAAEIAALKGAN